MTSSSDLDSDVTAYPDAGLQLNTANQSALTQTVTNECILFRFVVYTLIMGVMCLIGLVGNSLAFLVLRRDRSTPVASFLLQCLALADNCYLAVWILNFAIRDLFKFLNVTSVEKQPLWLLMRVYSYPLLYLAQTEMIWLTVIIALNRYMAVCLPYRATRLCSLSNVRWVVAGVTVFSCIYNTPRFFERYVHIDATNGTGEWVLTSLGLNKTYQRIYSDYLYYAFSFILPLLFLSVANGLVTCAYRRAQGRRRRLVVTTRGGGECERSITLVMILVVLLFILCQAPARFVQIMWSYTFRHCHHLSYFIIHTSNMLEVLNSSLNFVVYCLFHRRFRAILRSHVCGCDSSVRSRAASLSLAADGGVFGGDTTAAAAAAAATAAAATGGGLSSIVLRASGEGERLGFASRVRSSSPRVSTAALAVAFVSKKSRPSTSSCRKGGKSSSIFGKATLAKLCMDIDSPDLDLELQEIGGGCSTAGSSSTPATTSLRESLTIPSNVRLMIEPHDTTLALASYKKPQIQMKSLVADLNADGVVTSQCLGNSDDCARKLSSFEQFKLEDPFGGVYLGPNNDDIGNHGDAE